MNSELELKNNDQGLIDAALEIAERRAHTLRQLRDALVSGDDEKALSLARKVCGLDEKVYSTPKSFNRSAGRR